MRFDAIDDIRAVVGVERRSCHTDRQAVGIVKLDANPFTRALREGRKQLGLWVSLSHNYAAEAVASAGFDWVVCDMEHSPNDLATVLAQLQVFAASASTAIVRVPWNDPVMVKRLLDIGPPGLLFPMVQSAGEARQAVAATRYPPRGIRGVAGTTRANAFGRIKKTTTTNSLKIYFLSIWAT